MRWRAVSCGRLDSVVGSDAGVPVDAHVRTAPSIEPLALLGPVLAEAPGTVALACHHLVTGERFELRGDEPMPAAGLIQVPLAVAAHQAAERGELSLEDRPAADAPTWRALIRRMLVAGDIAATDALIDRLGAGAIEALSETLSLTNTTMRRRNGQPAAHDPAAGDATTTAGEMVTLLTALHRGDLVDTDATDELTALLRSPRDVRLDGGVPVGVPSAGTADEAGRCHVARILGGAAPWVLVVLAEGEPPLTEALIVRLATEIANHFEHRMRDVEAVRRRLVERRAALVPDARLAFDTLAIEWRAGEAVRTGATTVEARWSETIAGVRDEAEFLVGRPGVVAVPCLQVRREPGHTYELVSQARLGDPVTLLQEGPNGWLLRTPDGRVGYGKRSNLRAGDGWSPTHRVTAPLVTVTASDGAVFQLSAGSRLVALGGDEFALPDGRECRVPPGCVRPCDDRGTPGGVLAFARRLLGLPYLWGGATSWGIDCSGLVQLAHAVEGVSLPRDADQQQAATAPIATTAELTPGDLVFFPGHVGLALGDDEYLHASAQVGFVTVNSFDPAAPHFHPWLSKNFTAGGRSPLAC